MYSIATWVPSPYFICLSILLQEILNAIVGAMRNSASLLKIIHDFFFCFFTTVGIYLHKGCDP